MAFDPITAIAGIIDKIIPDRAQADAAKATLQNMREDDDVKLAMAQIAVNQADAQSSSKFQAWWRPALAWICLCDVAYETMLFPVFKNYIHIDTGSAIQVTMPILLTLIGARSFDKYNTVDTK